MGRYAKPISQISGNHITKEEREKRLENEEKLRGNSDKIRAPKGTNKEVKKIFDSLYEELKDLKILSNLDVHVMMNVAYAIYNITECRRTLEKDGMFVEGRYGMVSHPAIAVEKTYQAQFDKNSSKLGMSPADRMRFAMLNLEEKTDDEIDMIFGG